MCGRRMAFSFNINIKILSFLCATLYVSVERKEWEEDYT
jgi:hypothetical protein